LDGSRGAAELELEPDAHALATLDAPRGREQIDELESEAAAVHAVRRSRSRDDGRRRVLDLDADVRAAARDRRGDPSVRAESGVHDAVRDHLARQQAQLVDAVGVELLAELALERRAHACRRIGSAGHLYDATHAHRAHGALRGRAEPPGWP
jgi:hypothetical protein